MGPTDDWWEAGARFLLFAATKNRGSSSLRPTALVALRQLATPSPLFRRRDPRRLALAAGAQPKIMDLFRTKFMHRKS
jgi:hypothetical protein